MILRSCAQSSLLGVLGRLVVKQKGWNWSCSAGGHWRRTILWVENNLEEWISVPSYEVRSTLYERDWALERRRMNEWYGLLSMRCPNITVSCNTCSVHEIGVGVDEQYKCKSMCIMK